MRFNIKHLMVVVAVTAGAAAWPRIPTVGALTVAAVLAILPTSIAVVLPFLSVSSGRRLWVATWIASLWPLLGLWWIHVAWLVAYGFLGHLPGPTDNTLVTQVLGMSALVFQMVSLFSTVVGFCFPFGIISDRAAGKRRWIAPMLPIVVMPLAWFTYRVVGRWDPLGAVDWMMD